MKFEIFYTCLLTVVANTSSFYQGHSCKILMVDANLVYYFWEVTFTPVYQYHVIQFPLGDVFILFCIFTYF